ncbi:unnamed protein product [Rotaria magnacalcarata]|uniref:Uncharacterized protein n=1 Tax=Rotaria magnacalcarata TaxID=392030 RepID=A0A816MLT1_9BILA|nr:unnamed protein product [Rotaria magnacalcarata]
MFIIIVTVYQLHAITEQPKKEKCVHRNIPIAIIYNRVPKCGSTLMNTLLGLVFNKSHTFRFIRSRDYRNFRLSATDQLRLRQQILNYSRQVNSTPIVYERHFHFVDFGFEMNNNLFYINQLRDPLKRVLSSYDYTRHNCKIAGSDGPCALKNRSLINITIDTCVSTGDPSWCISEANGVPSAISFFCGQLSICDDTYKPITNYAALALAKSNIERYYPYVGLLEYIESSLELLEFSYPAIFRGISEFYQTYFKDKPVYRTPAESRYPINNKTRTTLRRLLKLEFELYYFVQKRFIDQYRQIFHRAPRRQDGKVR